MFYQLNKGENYDNNGDALKNWLLNHRMNLTNLTLEDNGEATITNLTDLCYNFINVTNIDFSNFNTSNVVECYRMCEKCTTLRNASTINLPNCTNARAIFSECRNLSTFPLKPKDFVSDSTYRYAYSNCRNITEDIYGINITNCNLTVTFNNVSSRNVYDINISNSDLQNGFVLPQLVNITNFTVDNCKSFDFSQAFSITKVEDLRIYNISSGLRLFRDRTRLTDVINLDIVNTPNIYSMFNNCKNLRNLSVVNFDATRDISNTFTRM